ncbi:hypothetical protein [Aeromonas salmonicida]|uniref:hypothetical protein n=1 Tax=Aeromonas salmonicida TaxID=645 RepID=UPI0039A4D538
MAYPVKWYASEMQGAPSLGDTADGALAALLKAVMVTGFGTLTINALAWDAAKGWAVATFSGGHAYLQDSVVEVGGVSPAAYNGEHRVMQVSSTQVWFELDAGDPGASGSGAAMTMKVAGLGWTITHESGDGKVLIIRPTNVSEAGNISLRIDNTAWSGWTGPNSASYPMYLAKVFMVEDVIDINTFTIVWEHRWPCTKRYSNGRWDIIGDSQLFYFLPAFSVFNRQFGYLFGYMKSIRPGDRYHAVLVNYQTTAPAATQAYSWSYAGNVSYGSTLPTFEDTSYRAMARPYHQLFGTVAWWLKGLFPRFGTGLNMPNAPDNGFYISTDPIMVLETGNQLRGFLPGMVVPYNSISAWDRKNFRDLPALPGKTIRFIHAVFGTDVSTGSTMLGFDLIGPWR